MNTRRYQMTARAATVEQTGGRILDAARDAWSRTSFTDIRLEALAEAADVTVPTIVRRFGGKAGVVVALVEREFAALVADRASGVDDPVATVVDNLVDFYEAYAELILKMYSEAPLVDGLDALASRARQYHVDWCRQTFDARLPECEPAVRARRLAQLTAVCDASTWRILRFDGGLDAAETRAALTELVGALLDPL